VPDARRIVGEDAPGGPSMSVHDYDLSIAFPLKSLQGFMDQTFAEAKLENCSINMRFLN
jgi:hypothetical protein